MNSRSGIASSTGISWVIAMSNVYSSDRILLWGGVYSLKPCFEVCLATSKVPEFAQSFMASFSKEDGLQIWSRDRACHLDWRRLVSGSRFWHYGKPECRYRSQLQYAQRCDNWSGKPRQRKVRVLGDCVWLGVNSTIVGGVRLGNDVLVAPNTYVNCDVPSHSIVIGHPCKIISRDGATDEYINNRV